MYEDEIPKELIIGETYTGEQLKAYVGNSKNATVYTDDTSPLVKHINFRITAVGNGYPYNYNSQSNAIVIPSAEYSLYFAKVVKE